MKNFNSDSNNYLTGYSPSSVLNSSKPNSSGYSALKSHNTNGYNDKDNFSVGSGKNRKIKTRQENFKTFFFKIL
jgi:hypothetical protein